MTEETVERAQQVDDAIEETGGTTEEAQAALIGRLGGDASKIAMRVVSRGTTALPGESVSASSAKVRGVALDEYALKCVNALTELLARMEIVATVGSRLGDGDGTAAPVILDVAGEDLGLLIGWRGETLNALQTVVNLMSGGYPTGRRVVVDVEHYRERREAQVAQMAQRVADRVRETGQAYKMDPMRSYERRAAHLALESDATVRTESMGEDPGRRVVIHPTGPAIPRAQDDYRGGERHSDRR